MAPNQTNRTLVGPPCVSSINLRKESERLKTFRNWPLTYLSPEELAADGFYFLGIGDAVRCAFCGIEVNNWTQGDVAHTDHQKWSPQCDMVLGIPCGNIPKGDPLSDEDTGPSVSYDTCGPFSHFFLPHSGPERACSSLPESVIKDLEHLGVSKIQGPKSPQFSTLEARLKTFANWPEDNPAKPQELAEAGFYYKGEEDHTICFYCDGGLRAWEAGDDPWIEHARWFDKCGYLLLRKGREFVTKVASSSSPTVLSMQEINSMLKEPCSSRDLDSGCSSECSPPGSPKAADFAAEPSRPLQDMELCKICYARQREIVLLPCGHFVSCGMCTSALSKCPVCRKPLEGTLRAYLS